MKIKRCLALVLSVLLMTTSAFSVPVNAVENYAEEGAESYVEESSEEALTIDEINELFEESIYAVPEEELLEESSLEDAIEESTEEELTEEETFEETSEIEETETEEVVSEVEETEETEIEESEEIQETEALTEEAEEVSEIEETESEEAEEIEELEETEEVVTEGFAFSALVEGQQIELSAEAGVLPSDTEVSIEKTYRALEDDFFLEGAVKEALTGDDQVISIDAFRIELSENGETVDIEDGAVDCSIALSEAMAAVQATFPEAEVKVFSIESGKAEELDIDLTNEAACFELDSSLYYAVIASCEIYENNGYKDNVNFSAPSTEGLFLDDSLLLDGAASASSSKYILPNLEPTRDQNPYGTCWAHATLCSVETYLDKIYGNKTRNLSELQLAYSAYHTLYSATGGFTGDTVTGAAEDFLDGGGNYYMSTYTLMSWNGPVNESVVPYSNAASVLAANSLSTSLIKKASSRVTDVLYVDPTTDRAGVKSLLVKYGSVGLSYCSDWSYYNSSYNSFYTPYYAGTNHAVSIVGWDDDFSKYNFGSYTPAGNGAWYIRNSWSTGSGQYYTDYFWMSYYDKSIGSLAACFKATSTSTYDNNYQYDGNTATGYTRSYNGETVAANIFTAKNTDGETLKAVSFYTTDAGVSYTIKIYKNPSSTDPESGTLVSSATTSGKRTYAGYHTIKLDNAVKLSYGTKFSVVISLKTSDGSGATIGTEGSMYSYGSNGYTYYNCAAKAGQSFMKSYGSWTDYGSSYNKNIRIKAYTTNTAESTVTYPKYNIKFSANGGTGTTKSMTDLTYSKSYTLTANGFKRSLYIFTGWNTKKDGSGKTYKDKASITKLSKTGATVVLYAQWTKTCKITYVLNGGKNNSNNVSSFTIKSSGTIKLYSPTRTGYTFKGWYTTKSFTSGTKVTYLNKKTSKNYKVYAKWEPQSYTLKLVSNYGSTNSVLTYKLDYTKKITLSDSLFTRKGYTLVGWSTSTSAKDIKYYPNEVRSKLASAGATRKLYAIWTKTKNSAIECPDISLAGSSSSSFSWVKFYSVNDYDGNLNIKVFKPEVVEAYQDSYWGQYATGRRDVNFRALKAGRSLIKITNDRNSSAIYLLYVYTGTDTYISNVTSNLSDIETLMKEEKN